MSRGSWCPKASAVPLALACGHRVQRRRLQPAHRGAFAQRSNQSGRERHSQDPPAKQHGLRGGAPGASCFSGAEEPLDAVLRRGSKKGADICKPFKPVPPVERAVHAQIGEEIFLVQRAQSRTPGRTTRDAAMIDVSAIACGFRNSRQCSSTCSPVVS